MHRGGSDLEADEDEGMQLLRDRFRLSVISNAETEAKKYDMEVSAPVMSCVSDLAFKLTEQLAKDLELFAHHGNRKSVNIDDVILSAHRNEHVATLLRSMALELKAKEPQTEKKRKKTTKQNERTGAAEVLDLS